MQVKFMQMRTKASEFDGEFKWQAAGMCDIVQTAQNRFIVIDGGWKEDVPHVLELLRSYAGEEKPRVALWIITHPHADHYEALETIAKDEALRGTFALERLCCRMPEDGHLPGTGNSFEADFARMRALEAALGVPVLTPYSGLWLDIDGVGLRFFSTSADVKSTPTANDLSLVFQVIGPNKTVMVTGDVHERGATPAAYRWWNELKSDICQLGHHGFDGGSVAFYQQVAAKTVLIPISASGYRYIHDLKAGCVPPLFAERMAERAVKAFEGDAVLAI